jgi:mycofactocin system glycosyltransferase
VIPLEYRLRDSVRLQPTTDGSWRVVSEVPLSILKINAAAARLLERTRHGATIADLAAGLCIAEERIFTLCEYFRSRGILEVGRAAVDPDFTPSVTVIVPTRDRASDLDDCLSALARLNYPGDRLKVIVVDDGSADPDAVARVVARHGGHLLANERNRGPSYSRNRAAREAGGEILALIDSDCEAGPGWLQELTPYFSWERVGAVGGRTIGYYTQSRLDRYEEVASPLDMGRHLVLKTQGTDTFYVPTCNLLVRRSVYLDLGGLREDLLVGEDVDFCWRLRAAGAFLVYAPEGTVRHKHRNGLGAMLRRRADYGTSEATLHALHRDKRKRFPPARAPLVTVAVVSAALVKMEPRLLPLGLAPPLWDGARRSLHLRRNGIDMPARRVWSSVLRAHLSMLSFTYFHLVRYYLVPLTAAGLFAPGVRLLTAFAVLYSSAVDYSTKRPRIDYPTYLAYYLAEHTAYQIGVFAGCVRARTFRSYLPAVQRDRLLGDLPSTREGSEGRPGGMRETRTGVSG